MASQIKFKYKFPEDYNPVYINGAHGGINSQGEIIANFYFERIPVPNALTHIINDNGSLGEAKEYEPADLGTSLVRYIQNGVVMNIETARQLCDWLINQINQAEKQIAQNKEQTSKT